MFILLRTEGGGDYVKPVADRLLGSDAQECRASLAEWKGELRRWADTLGMASTAELIRQAGSPIANELNVRNWCSPANIGPLSKVDFLAVLTTLGMLDKQESLWAVIRRVRKARHRAGNIIRRRLMQEVRSAAVQGSLTRGHIDFTLPEAEGGTLSALRIENRAPGMVQVAFNRLGRPFALGI